GVARDHDAAGGFLDSPADVDDVAVFVLQLFRRGKAAAGQAAEYEDFAPPGAGDDVLDAVAVEGHELRTQADASRRRPAPLLLPCPKLRPRLVQGLRVRADVLVEPQDAVAELADEEIIRTVAVEIDDERRRVAHLRIDRFARRLQPHGRCKAVRY